MNNDALNRFSSKDEEIDYLKNENKKLTKINDALIFRVEEGATNDVPYSSFERSVNLTVQVNQKTQELNDALSKLQRLNKSLSLANKAANIFKQRFVEAIESITDGFVLLDQDGNIIFQNSNFERFWKNSELSPIEGSNYNRLKSLGKLKGTILSITADDDQQSSVYHLNNDRWYQLKERKTQEGGVVILFTDITHIKNAESQRFEIAIAEKNALLQSLIDNLSQGVLLINEDDSPEVWNLQFERFCQLSTKTIQEVSQLQDFTAITELSLLTNSNKYVHIQELPNGTVIDVRRHFLADGKSIITLADITEQHQYELSLKESEIWLRTITDNVPAMIAYVNNKKRFIFTNKVYNKWYGQDGSELIGKALEETHLFDDYKQLDVFISRVLSGETVTFESREFNHDGVESYLLKSYVPNISEQGEVVGFFVLINNITERILAAHALQGANLELEERVLLRTLDLKQEVESRKTAQLRLSDAIRSAELANESKSKFLAAVSHDLLQPLNAAKLFAESLFHDFGLTERPILNSIKNSLNDLENLIVTLVDISKLDAGLVNPDKQIFALNSLLENISGDYQKISILHLIDFSFVPTSVYVESDSLLLARILRNYLSNAIRYAKGKKVTLGCRRRGDNIEIQVWDTGDGIAQENLHEIFKEFKRLKGAVHAQHSLGLGLAIVEKMAKVLDHGISVKSELGKGSCFSILLPIKKVDLSMVSNRDQSAILSSQISGAKVWMVDNDLAICDAMRLLMTRWGCEVITAGSYDELSELVDLRHAECDLLLVDYHLDNDQTGIMVAQQINENRRVAIPTIMISANYKQELREQCKENNIFLLNKPVKPLKLRMIMQQCILE
jgi:PAS domain S-box-containing protein